MHRVTRHLRQNVVAYLALLFALSGTSYAGAVGKPLSQDRFSPYTLQLSDIGHAYYRVTAAHVLSNARTIKEGTPATLIRRFGRIAGYERQFLAKHILKQDLVAIGSGVTGTRTAAGAHRYFLWGTKPSRLEKKLKGARLHRLRFPRIGAESVCYSFKNRVKGIAFLNFVCYWRQHRLLGSLGANAFWVRRLEVPLIVPVGQLVAMQARRMVH
jgi:hypothetical protein